MTFFFIAQQHKKYVFYAFFEVKKVLKMTFYLVYLF